MEAHQVSLRALAARLQLSPGHLSRVLRQAGKTATPETLRALALAFNLPEDYFVEYREAVVIEAVRRDAALRERIYAEIREQS
jgi:transcriptional regulator with XRE-family HTH domain